MVVFFSRKVFVLFVSFRILLTKRVDIAAQHTTLPKASDISQSRAQAADYSGTKEELFQFFFKGPTQPS